MPISCATLREQFLSRIAIHFILRDHIRHAMLPLHVERSQCTFDVNRVAGQLLLAIFLFCFSSVRRRTAVRCTSISTTTRHPMHNWWMRLARSATVKIKRNGFCYIMYYGVSLRDGMFGPLLSNKPLCDHTINKNPIKTKMSTFRREQWNPEINVHRSNFIRNLIDVWVFSGAQP